MKLLLIILILLTAGCGLGEEGDEGGDGGRDSSGCEFTIVGDNNQGSCAIGGDATNIKDAALEEACKEQSKAECLQRGNVEKTEGFDECFGKALAKCKGDGEDDDDDSEEPEAKNESD